MLRVVKLGGPAVQVKPQLTGLKVIRLGGLPGADGQDGQDGLASGQIVSKTAGAAISGHRAVRHNSSGLMVYASADQPEARSVYGISLGAASSGQSMQVQTLGDLEEPSWTWTPGLPIYLGLNGALTQTVPVANQQIQIGVAITATKAFIRLGQAIELI